MKEKHSYINFLRIISMFFVIGLHTVADNLRTKYFGANWYFANITSAIMTVAVPVFFMISGAMILSSDKTEDISYTLKKRLPKIIIPFLVWSVIAVGYFFIKEFFYDEEGIHYYDRIVWRLTHITTTPITVHFWFIYALIPLYVLSPFILKIIKNSDNKLIKYFFFIWIIFSGILPTISATTPLLKNICAQHYSYNLNMYSGYLGYFIAGYYLHNTKRRFNKKALAVIFVVNTALIVILTSVYTGLCEKYFEGFKTYSGIFCMISSVSFFLLIKEIFSERKEGRISAFLSGVSFCVYLCHNLIIGFMNINEWVNPETIPLTLLRYVIVAVSSILITVILGSGTFTSYIFTGNPKKISDKTCNIQSLFH